MAATRRQIEMLNVHKRICMGLSIPQSTFQHKHLKGTVSQPNAQGNVEYKGPGPLTTFDGEIANEALVWLVYQPFIRGEERVDDFAPGILEVALQEGQMPAIDDDYNVLTVSEDDFLVTPDGVIWTVQNPVISPDQGWYTFLLEEKR